MSVTKRNTNKHGLDLSLLGFGCMRFPTTVDGKIDEVRAEKMLDDAYAAGVNYFDTAYPYHSGASEPFTGRVLGKYPRDSYYLATKLPCWEVNTLDDAKRLLDLQCSRIDGNYIDFYLLHALNRGSWAKMRDLGVVEYLEEQQKAGRIRQLGFSFHDDYAVLEDIVSYKDWDFCQLQLNYMDTEDQAGMKGYNLTAEKNIPITIMEPIKGGLLANLPDEVGAVFKDIKPEESVASWALRWVASLPNVMVVLSGMSDEMQLADNLATFTDFEVMSDEENAAVEKVACILKQRVNNGCTGCAYCMPCPVGVNIPENFKIWNRYGIYGNAGDVMWHWNNDLDEKKRASNCIRCGKCEKACPQKLAIRDDLVRVQKLMDELKAAE